MSQASSQPVLLSPALPSELLTHVLRQHRHPTVLVICSPRQTFLSRLVQDVLQQIPSYLAPADNGSSKSKGSTTTHRHDGGHSNTSHGCEDNQNQRPDVAHPAEELLTAPLAQVAVSRHIRLVFVPTVTHLEAWLAVFSPENTAIPPPPPVQQQPHASGSRHDSQPWPQRPLLLVYGFLSIHRDTSEWSVQGISRCASALIEAAHRNQFRAMVAESLEVAPDGEVRTLEKILREEVPILSGTSLREIGGDKQWACRTVSVESVMKRWFIVQQGEWGDWSDEAAATCPANGRAQGVMPLSSQVIQYDGDDIDNNLSDNASPIMLRDDIRFYGHTEPEAQGLPGYDEVQYPDEDEDEDEDEDSGEPTDGLEESSNNNVTDPPSTQP